MNRIHRQFQNESNESRQEFSIKIAKDKESEIDVYQKVSVMNYLGGRDGGAKSSEGELDNPSDLDREPCLGPIPDCDSWW